LHPECAQTANLANITAGLVLAVHPSPHELELGVGHDPFDCRATHIASRPLNYTQYHPPSLPE